MRQFGFTLTELLLSLTLGLTVTAACLHLLSAMAQTRMATIGQQHLHQELDSLLNRISRDLRRQSYAGQNAIAELIHAENPLAMDALTGQVLLNFQDIENSDQDITSYDCLLFAYDANHNGHDDGADERFGYRFTENTLKMRGNADNCQQSGWVRISDDQTIRITQSSFRPIAHSSALNNQWISCSILIMVQGQLLNQPEQQLTLRQLISLPNPLHQSQANQRLCQ